MTEPSDPARLTRDPSAGPLRDLMRAGEQDLPSDRQLSRLAGRLEPTFAAPTAGAASPASALAPKLLLGALGVAGVAALVFGLRGAAETEHAAPVVPVATPAPSAAGIAPLPPAANEAPTAPPVSSAVEVAPTPSASGAAVAGPSARGGGSSNDGARKVALGEAALLERARSALGSEPARALALTRQHQARFPNGVLKQEREVIAIEALRRLGRAQAASERAGSFERDFPDSAHRRKVETGVPK